MTQECPFCSVKIANAITVDKADKSKISKWCLVHIFFADYGGKI